MSVRAIYPGKILDSVSVCLDDGFREVLYMLRPGRCGRGRRRTLHRHTMMIRAGY